MSTQPFKVALLLVLAIAFSAPPCLAKATGHFFVVAYSYKDKAIHCSKIFTAKVRKVSYNKEEYVTEMSILQKIEAAFEKYMSQVVGADMAKYTLSSRGAFKSRNIALKYLQAEKDEHGKKGLAIHDAEDFKFKK